VPERERWRIQRDSLIIARQTIMNLLLQDYLYLPESPRQFYHQTIIRLAMVMTATIRQAS
jgi:hypothetical protein